MFIERSDAAKRSCCASACRCRQALVICQNSMSMLIRFGQNWWVMALPMMPATILVVGAMARGNIISPEHGLWVSGLILLDHRNDM
jgi:hypothetical protein